MLKFGKSGSLKVDCFQVIESDTSVVILMYNLHPPAKLIMPVTLINSDKGELGKQFKVIEVCCHKAKIQLLFESSLCHISYDAGKILVSQVKSNFALAVSNWVSQIFLL